MPPADIATIPTINKTFTISGSMFRYVGGDLHSMQALKNASDSSFDKGMCNWDNPTPNNIAAIPEMKSSFGRRFTA
jgi:hypothetical protein